MDSVIDLRSVPIVLYSHMMLDWVRPIDLRDMRGDISILAWSFTTTVCVFY